MKKSDKIHSETSVGSLDCRRVQHFLENQPGFGKDTLCSEAFVEQHIAYCSDCQAFVEDEKRMSLAFKTLPQLTVAEDFSTQVMNRIKQRSPRRKPAIVLRSIAAGFAILVSAGFLASIISHNPATINADSAFVAFQPMEETSTPRWITTVTSSSDQNDEITDDLQDVVGF